MINRKNARLSLYFGSAALLALAANVHADSQRIQLNSNKHFYQRFDQRVAWKAAETNCETQGATLVTITDAAEQSFVYNNLGANRSSDGYYLGGSDSVKEGKYTWVTGEKWSYTYWNGYHAAFGDAYDYAYINWDNGYNGSWLNGDGIGAIGYICEWSTDNYVGLAIVPDMNANGSDEVAALYVDYVTAKHTVKIRDPKTNTLLSTLTFKSGFQPPQGVIAIDDINGNGMPEIGVLYSEYGQPSVGIKDAKNNKAYLNTLRFLTSGYSPQQIAVSPDSNGNGTSEITVLGIGKNNNTPKAEIRDSSTGAVLGDTKF